MGKYLEEAKGFFEEALEELERFKIDGDIIALRNASEKAWVAVVLATNELMERMGEKVAEGHSARKVFLHSLGKRDKRIRRLNLEYRYSTFMDVLHRDCFYEGICPAGLIEDYIKEVRVYIKEIEKLPL